MPVWHARTKVLREQGKLVLIGITQEQHPDRCQLFSQWHQLDWPILWDPFNLTDSEAVPLAIGIDEHGIVRKLGLGLEDLDEFVSTEFEPPELSARLDMGVAKGEAKADSPLTTSVEAMATLLWSRAQVDREQFAAAIEVLGTEASGLEAANARFRYGVALRMRYDSPQREPGDFQRSLDAWSTALDLRPTQYIWRRRIQQWGPTLDKPYPFYLWIADAEHDIIERGETPHPIQVPLTTSELSGRERAVVATSERSHPDPERKLPRAKGGWVSIESAVAPDTSRRSSVQVHLVLRPSSERGVTWSNDAGPTEIWIENASDWGLARPDFVLDFPVAVDSSKETRRVDFTATLPEGGEDKLRGTAFYFVCGDDDHECRYLAQDFQVVLAHRD